MAFFDYKWPCRVLLVWSPWSSMVSKTIYVLYILYFPAVKHRRGAPPSASRGEGVGVTLSSKFNLSLHWMRGGGGGGLLRAAMSHPP